MILDPGFRTGGVGIGTALGVSVCYEIIRDHRGEVKVTSEVRKGRLFTIILPTSLRQILNDPWRRRSEMAASFLKVVNSRSQKMYQPHNVPPRARRIAPSGQIFYPMGRGGPRGDNVSDTL